jgi:uncharacterized membrane-anchored protein
MDVGLIGALIGGAVGVFGGAIGTYFSIKNTAGSAERSFMIRASVVFWVAATVFLVCLFMLPRPFNWLLWMPYMIALPMGIRWVVRRQGEIRADEASARSSGSERV